MAGPGRIYTIAERHRRELLAGERAAATEMVRYYGATWQRLKVSLDGLLERIEQARKAGARVSPAWLYQEERYRALMAQVETEMAGLARYAESSIVAQQAQAIALAQEHAQQLVLTGLEPAQIAVSWTRLPAGAIEEAVGFMRPDSPLHKLLARLPGEAAKDVERELVVGVATGAGPAETARRVRKALGGNSARALTIARTETLRAYREATHQSYLANAEYLDGWMWVCAKGPRTCAACLAMDGTKHRLNERLDDHPNGRCVMAPLPKGIEMPKRQTGAEWFEAQEPEVQRRVLGNAGYEAYSKGEVTLQDFVGRKRSRDWGTMRYARSLRVIRAAA